MVRGLAFAKIHAFRFSPRPGTIAAELKDPISESIKKSRMQSLASVEETNLQLYLNGIVGEKRMAVVEREALTEAPGYALSDDYLRLYFEPSSEGSEIHRGDIQAFHVSRIEEGNRIIALPLIS